MSYLHTKFHDNLISSFRGVAMTRFWDGRSDCTPRPSFLATQVKSRSNFIKRPTSLNGLMSIRDFTPTTWSSLIYT